MASPSDVEAERAAITDAVNEINILSSDSLGAVYEIRKWETHTRPAFGVDAQDVINHQIADSYEVFVGIMWARFGSPTNRAESGTVEEFDRAIARWKSDPSSVEVMFYFKDAPLNPSKIDTSQLGKVNAFKERISNDLGGLYHGFDSTEEFKTKIRVHLSTLLNALALRTGGGSVSQSGFDTTSQALRNFSALQEEEEEEDVDEISDRGVAAMGRVGEIATAIAAATENLGEQVGKKTEELNRLIAAGLQATPAEAKKHTDDVGGYIESFVAELLRLIPEFRRQHEMALEYFTKLIILSNALPQKPVEEMRFALGNLAQLRLTMMTSAENVAQLQATVSGMPRATSAFNRAKKRATAILTDLFEQIDEAANSTLGVEKLLEGAIEKERLT